MSTLVSRAQGARLYIYASRHGTACVPVSIGNLPEALKAAARTWWTPGVQPRQALDQSLYCQRAWAEEAQP